MVNRTVLILVLTGMGLISCNFVHQDDITTNEITYPSYLRVYQHNDTIRYTIENVNLQNEDSEGTMDVKWETDNTIQPPAFDIDPIPLLLKVTYTQNYLSDEHINILYSSQITEGTQQGSFDIYALSSEPFWLTTKPTQVFDEVTNIQLVNSPYQIIKADKNTSLDYTIAYTILHECDSTQCNAHAKVSETQTINYLAEPKVIGTQLGSFQTYQVNYTGSIQPEPGQPIKGIFDFRAFCGPIGTTDIIHFYGIMYIYPDIGPVRIDNTCYYSDTLPVHVIYYIDSTSINYAKE